MKLPASSSVFLTTLAISSSSSCLAAPTADTSAGHSMSSSASNRHLDGASAEGQVQPRSEGYANFEARNLDLLQSVKDIISELSVVGPPFSHMLDANNPPSAQDLSNLKNAADEVNRALSAAGGATNSTVPPTVGSTPGEVSSHASAPIAGALSDDPNGGASASAATPSQTVAAADAPSSSAQPTAPPTSPAPPSGPPNTPALPVNV